MAEIMLTTNKNKMLRARLMQAAVHNEKSSPKLKTCQLSLNFITTTLNSKNCDKNHHWCHNPLHSCTKCFHCSQLMDDDTNKTL